ncbi:deah-box rna helicase [Lasallia pustulata]|uniref:RNA helicase n=1 Tax=Lasallia pustulata TaxID=136370 RepID=A0A1W5D6V2_9LECA|nr:deah-box rna helicase [Lasallia pustulata]
MPKFVARQRKHKALRRTKNERPSETRGDSNAVEILPLEKAQQEEKRRVLKAQMRAQQPKMSSKKQKRLDKYIDTKLRKEENLELIKKLAAAKVDTSLLRSSKALGASKQSKRELLSQALKEQQAGIHVQKNGGRLIEARDLSDEDIHNFDVSSEAAAAIATKKPITGPIAASTVVGTGLKRPLEIGADGNPVIKRRRQLKKRPVVLEPASEPEWDGFDSSADSGISSEGSDSEAESASSQVEEDSSSAQAPSLVSSDDGSEITSEDDRDEEIDQADRKERSSAFKAWATQQVNEALGFTPTAQIQVMESGTNSMHQLKIKPRIPEQDPLPPELEITSRNPLRKAFSVQVQRPPQLQEARLQLPVVAEEQKIMEAIHNNPSVVIWGATGSGKTTQVPQFLYEAGYGSPDGPTPGMIGVTQPRRVAAVSMAKRVSDEMGNAHGKVSYQIRFESTVSDKTAIKYMTDGILIREIGKDFALTKYSAVVIDEAHERSTNTDILIGMVSRIVDLRTKMSQEDPKITPLKLIIMSATLRISDFTENTNLFRSGPPPLLQAEGRQYPVSIHFARKTQRDYLDEAFLKVSKGHKKLPPGGMLVFLTGQNEIIALVKRLREAFPSAQNNQSNGPRVQITSRDAPLETEDFDIGNERQNYENDDEGSELEVDGLDDEEDRQFDIGKPGAISLNVYILPLYSQLPTKEQLRVFEPPPENARLIVLATNVAETSITIPGIRYVFDCGRSKEKKYDRMTGVQSFEVDWISKASASQRAGRAGRTGPGHCYRLYSSAVYERDFEEYAEPEILRMPVEGVVLQLKSMDLQHVVNFPFPTPPDRQSLQKAEKLLTYLGAVSSEGKITPIGRDLSIYPLSPRLSKILLIGHQHACMPYTIALVAALAVPEIFIPESQLDLTSQARNTDEVYSNVDRLADTAREQRKKDYNHAHHLFSMRDKTSDALKLLTAFCAYAYAPNADEFCTSMFLRAKALKDASQLQQQLSDIVRANRPGVIGSYEERLPEAGEKQLKALKQIVAAGFIDQIAVRADLSSNPPEMGRKPKRAIDVPYLPLFPAHIGKTEGLGEKAVYIHPSSVLAHTPPKDLPQYIVYSQLQRSAPSTIKGAKTPKIRMHALTSISGNQIAALARRTPLVEYGKPIGKIVTLEGKPERRECWVVPSLVGEKGGTGWPLPAQKVVQIKEGVKGWVIEKVVG